MKKIKLPFVSRKRYEKSQTNLKIMNNARLELNNRVEQLSKINRENGIDVETKAKQINALKIENKRLKTLLTRNGIQYKKDVK